MKTGAFSSKKAQKSSRTVCGLPSLSVVLFGLAFSIAVIIFYSAHFGGHLVHDTVEPLKAKFRLDTTKTKLHIQSGIYTLPTSAIVPKPEIYNETTNVINILLNHPLHRLSSHERSKMSLEDHFLYLQNQTECKSIPIFTSMANVFSDLYWQLIENFIYSMTKFGLSSCTIMVCVSDLSCMKLCEKSHFPCYDFQYKDFHPGDAPLPSALEQIGELKLFHLPKVLSRGVDVMMLDLDVGFIDSPMHLVRGIGSSKSDVFVQMDITFVMNRTLEGWRTWFTEPQPNIGIMLCRGNAKTVRMFDIAWKDYKAIKKPIKHNPGKDQNKVVFAMRVARRFGLRWEYIPQHSAVLLDKIYKFEHNTTYELGGDAAVRVLQQRGATAVHTTCYEQKSKVMGLKAANAFWNPFYYNPLRRTLTKQLLYLTDQQLRWEIRSLLYLGIVTNRAVIIPNILGNERLQEVQLFDQQALWPGFRVAYFQKGLKYTVDILEPAFYWRVKRDYDGDSSGSNSSRGSSSDSRSSTDVTSGNNKYNSYSSSAPMPVVVELDTLELQSDLAAVERLLLSAEINDRPRIVLHTTTSTTTTTTTSSSTEHHHRLKHLIQWADSSTGQYVHNYEIESNRYGRLPNLGESTASGGRGVGSSGNSHTHTNSLKFPHIANNIMQNVRLCQQLMNPNMGNRSCFDKCK